jgi:uncharacterized BrkB/YihY/UPF0761 family membrane protein
MNRVVEKLDRLLFPEKLRRYVTFRSATIFATIVVIGSFALDAIIRPESRVGAAEQKLIHSPTFLVLNALVSILGFWLIYRTRENRDYYRFRVLFYGMFLGGLLTEMMECVLSLLGLV